MRLYMRHSTSGASTAATTGVGNIGFLVVLSVESAIVIQARVGKPAAMVMFWHRPQESHP
jgi:hypothetical protein